MKSNKTESQAAAPSPKGKAKIEKLRLDKETLRDLSPKQEDGDAVRGGATGRCWERGTTKAEASAIEGIAFSRSGSLPMPPRGKGPRVSISNDRGSTNLKKGTQHEIQNDQITSHRAVAKR